MTDKFDPDSDEHQRIKNGTEEGDNLPEIASIPHTLHALRATGLEILESHDAVTTSDPETPRYLPLVGETSSLLAIRRGRVGCFFACRTIRVLDALNVAPKGSVRVRRMLGAAAEALIAGGAAEIFTPNYFFLARRPAE